MDFNARKGCNAIKTTITNSKVVRPTNRQIIVT